MTLKQLSAIIATLSVILGAAFAIDNRYAHAAETKQQAKTDKAAIEQKVAQTDTELRLETYRLKIQFLNSKARLTSDEKDELAFTRKLVEKLQEQALKK